MFLHTDDEVLLDFERQQMVNAPGHSSPIIVVVSADVRGNSLVH
jgi:hypothetical protein